MTKPGPRFLLAAGVATAASLSVFSGSIDPYVADVATSIGINIILAVSLNLVNGYAGQFSLGHAGFMAVGAYLASAFTLDLGPRLLTDSSPAYAGQLLFLGALVVGGIGAAFAGLLVGTPSLRLRGDYLALVTLGFGEIIRVLIQNCEPLGGALGLVGMPAYTTLAWTYGAVALTLYVVSCLAGSGYGLCLLAVRDDEVAAQSLGIDTTRAKILAFVVGAFFAGIAGGLYAHFKLAIDPSGFDFTRSIEIVVMVIFGGMGGTTGVVVAAIVLTLLPEVLRPIAQYRMALYAFLLVLFMVLRPQGLFGPRKQGRSALKP